MASSCTHEAAYWSNPKAKTLLYSFCTRRRDINLSHTCNPNSSVVKKSWNITYDATHFPHGSKNQTICINDFSPFTVVKNSPKDPKDSTLLLQHQQVQMHLLLPNTSPTNHDPKKKKKKSNYRVNKITILRTNKFSSIMELYIKSLKFSITSSLEHLLLEPTFKS